MLILAYDGSGYHGWQVQLGSRTIQEAVEEALGKVLQHESRASASGRTDAGVHALGQVVHFETSSPIPEDGLLRAMNSVLPPDIRVLEAREVNGDFHARFHARAKTYAYLIDTSEVPSPFLFRYAMHLPGRLDIDAMARALSCLEGEHDFSSFMGAGSEVKTTTRTILHAGISARGTKVFFFIKGSGFLRHMVRNLVGTLILVGQGKMTPDDLVRIREARDRTLAGPTAPPQGLYLVGVEYGGDTPVLADDD